MNQSDKKLWREEQISLVRFHFSQLDQRDVTEWTEEIDAKLKVLTQLSKNVFDLTTPVLNLKSE